jgi:ABC-type antimicrobial peptide transport system permease subunit
MSQVLLVAIGALLVHFAYRVAQMKRQGMPFLIAYPVFVLIVLGGGVGLFVGAGWAAVAVGLPKEAALVVVYGVTAAGLIALWFVARRIIAGRK